ncbi:hypothetical protein SKC41_00625 [Mycobacterium sp. 050128]|uniref:hypothetical protein n=1 Tax=Mycobacterium sp. 050128 TaxID=3096112 RepID=UPI002ED89750
MAVKGRIDLRLGTQVLLVQLVVVALTLMVTFALFAPYNRHRLVQYGIHALDTARVVASAPTVLNISHYDAAPASPLPGFVDELATGPIQSVRSRVQLRTHVAFVVVATTRSVRLAPPDRDMLET